MDISNTIPAYLFYTRSGAVYAVSSGALIRFDGYEVRSYQLESGVRLPQVGEHIRALVLPANGKSVGTVQSTRVLRWVAIYRDTVYSGPRGRELPVVLRKSGLTDQEFAMAEMVLALDRVGRVGQELVRRTALPVR